MFKTRDFWKKILTTTTVTSALVLNAGEAGAVVRNVGGGNANLSAIAAGAFAASDTIDFNVGAGGPYTVTVNDYGNPAGGNANPVLIGSVTATGGTAGSLILQQNSNFTGVVTTNTITVNNGITGTFNSAGGPFQVAGNINGAGAGQGIVSTTGVNAITFTGIIGGGPALAAINIGSTGLTRFANTTAATAINIGAGNSLAEFDANVTSAFSFTAGSTGTMTFNGANNVGGAADMTIAGNIVNNNGAINNGTIVTAGAKAQTFTGTVGVGGSGALAAINIGSTGLTRFANTTAAAAINIGAGNSLAEFDANVTGVFTFTAGSTGTITFNGANKVGGAADMTITGNIVNNNGAAYNGTIVTAGGNAQTFTGTVGSGVGGTLAAINIGSTGLTKFRNNVSSAAINLGVGNSLAEFDANVTGVFTFTAGSTGTITFNGANNVGGAADMTINGNVFNNNGAINNGTIVTAGANAQTFTGTVGVGGNGALAAINIGSTGLTRFANTAVAAAINIGAGNSLAEFDANVTGAFSFTAGSTGTITFNGANYVAGGNNMTITGNIVNNNGAINNGTIVTAGANAQTFTGTVGVGGNGALAAINIGSTGLTKFQRAVVAAAINLGAGNSLAEFDANVTGAFSFTAGSTGTMTFNGANNVGGAADMTIAGNIVNNNGAANSGTIVTAGANAQTFTGTVGVGGNGALAAINIGSTGLTKFQRAVVAAAINLGAGNSLAEFDANVTGAFSFTAGSTGTMTFNGANNVGGAADMTIAGNIVNNNGAANSGTIVTAGANAQTFTGTVGVGGNGALAAINIGSTGLTKFQRAVVAAAINLGAGNSLAEFDANVTGAFSFTAGSTGTMTFNGANNVGGAADMTIAGNIVNNNGAANSGTIVTAGANAQTFTGTVGVGGNGALAAINIDATNSGGTAIFQKSVAAQTFTLGDNAATTLIFDANAGAANITATGTIDSSAANGHGILSITTGNNSTTFASKIGNTHQVSTINITGAGAVTFQQAVKLANTIDVSNAPNVEFAGALNAPAGLIFNLGTNALKLSGGGTVAGGNAVFNITSNVANVGGHINLNGGNLNLGAAGNVTLNVTGNTPGTVVVFDSANGGNVVLPANIVVNAMTAGSIVQWSLVNKAVLINPPAPVAGAAAAIIAPSGGNNNPSTLALPAPQIIPAPTNTTQLELSGSVDQSIVNNLVASVAPAIQSASTTSQAMFQQISEVNNNSTQQVLDAATLVNQIMLFSSDNMEAAAAAAAEVVERWTPNAQSDQLSAATTNTQVGSQISQAVASAAIASIGARVDSISPSLSSTPASSPQSPMSGGSARPASDNAGVSGGDSESEMGVWATAFGGAAHQKKFKQSSGYRSQIFGGSVGVDGAVDDNSLLGAAITFADTKVKQKGLRIGDNTKSELWMGSVYGVYDFENNLFARGILSYGYNKIKTTEVRTIGFNTTSNTEIKGAARSKYDSRSISTEIGLGYRYSLQENIFLSPSIALQYSNTVDGSHNESGAGNYVNSVRQRKYDQLNGVFGLGLGSVINQGALVFLPEIHATVNQRLSGKNPAVVSKLIGFDEVTTKISPVKTQYSAGLSLTIRSGMTDFGIGGDVDMAKKYLGARGSLKVRVNF